MFRQLRIVSMVTLLGLPLFFTSPAFPTQSDSNPDSVVATVNRTMIKQREVDSEIQRIKIESEWRNQPMGEEVLATLRDQVVEILIERELLNQQIQLKKIDVGPRPAENELADFKRRIGTAAFNGYLQHIGCTEAEFKTILRKGLNIQRFLSMELLRSLTVEESEIVNFVPPQPDFFDSSEQVRARHILVSCGACDERQRDAALREIQGIQLQLRSGTEFALLALAHSDCPSKSSGGDLGYMTRDQAIPEFVEVLFALQPGQISEIVSTRLGYHLIQMIERRPSSRLSRLSARAKVERAILLRKERTAIYNYIFRLKRQADIRR
jgi:parvulin-like peptidyl-prolyl isomerase